MLPAMRTATTSAYTAIIPDMTTGMRDYHIVLSAICPTRSSQSEHTFMIRSDLNVPTPAIPMPDFAVPYAAPMPVHPVQYASPPIHDLAVCLHPKIMANAIPAIPRKGANLGAKSSSIAAILSVC